MHTTDPTTGGGTGRRGWWRRPGGRVAALSLGLGLATLAVHAARLASDGLPDGWRADLVPTLALTAAFLVAKNFTVHIRVRRSSHGLNVSEVPLVFGLLSVDPMLVVVAYVVGGGLGKALRHQRGVTLGFNLALFGVSATVSALVFHGLVGQPGSATPMVWAATYAATLLADVVAAVLVTAVIALHDDPGEWRQLTQVFNGVPVVALTTTVALIGAIAVEHDIRAAVLLPLVIVMTYVGYRAYVRQSQGHAQVEDLYTFTRALDGLGDTDDVVTVVLTQVRDQLRAEVSTLVVPEGDGYVLTRLTGADALSAQRLADLPADAWWAPAVTGEPVLLPADKDRQPVNAMAVPLTVGGTAGVLSVSESLDDTPTFTDEHVRLFQALANHAGVALSKSLLVDRLRREAAEKEHLALHDQLTGLPNRQRFNQLVDDAVSGGRPGAVLLLDVDRFKEINDALGHDIGDRLLQEIGANLERGVGERGVVARLGGDEFAVLLPGTRDADTALAVAAELAAALERRMPVGTLQLSTRASIGIALAPEHGRDARTLLQRADVAMYAAKDTGSAGRLYQPEDDRNTPRRLAMIGELEKVVATRGLLLVFQPKTDPVSGVVVGAEALARWHHPEYGFVPPDEFIPLAEHSGLIRPLTLHVLEVALDRCAAWRRSGYDLHVAVNLSAISLLDATLPDVVARLLGRAGVPASALTLEITESSLTMDPVGSMRTLDRLNALGVRLSIDDFGTGYSSLGRLRELPIHEVKIDRSFVQRIAVDHRDRAVVRSAVQLGHALDLQVVAEGVEDAETYDHLAREGCNLVQGYHVSRPLPADDFLAWLRERHPLPVS